MSHNSFARPKTSLDDQAQARLRTMRWRILAKSLIVPLLVLVFFLAAPRWQNHRIRTAVLADLDESGRLPEAEKARRRAFFATVDFHAVCRGHVPGMEKLREGLEKGDICGTFQKLHWGLLASVAVVGILLGAIGLIVVLARQAGRSPSDLIRNYRLAWGVGMAAALVKVFLLIPLLTYGAFMLMVLLTDHYSVKLLAIIGFCGLAAIVGSVRALLKKSPLEFQESMARAITPEQAPELWQAVRQAAARLQTAPPDHILVGMQLNFYVTELSVRHEGGVVSGRTLYLSYPLLRHLAEEEVVAILGHELGHFMGDDTRLTREFFPLRFKVHGTMAVLAASALVSWTSLQFLSFFLWCFGETEQAMSRKRELLADSIAATLTSPPIMARALVKLHVVSEALGLGFQDALRSQNLNPLDLPLRQLIREKLVPQAEFWTGLFEKKFLHPMDSHPPLQVRLEALGQQIGAAEAQAMATEESESAYARWFSTRAEVFAPLTQQAEEAVSKMRSRTQVAEADYETAAGRELLTRHFPERKWRMRRGGLLGTVTVLALLGAGAAVPAWLVSEPVVRFIFGPAAVFFLTWSVLIWKRHRGGEFTLTAEGMSYTGWKRPVRFSEIRRITGQQHYSSVTAIFHLKEAQPSFWKFTLLPLPRKQLTITLSGLEGDKPAEIFQTIWRYATRQTGVES